MKKYLCLLPIVFLLFGCASVEKNSNGPKYRVTGYYIVDEKVPKPTILIAHGCDGVSNNKSYLNWALKLNKLGYNTVIVDSFSRRGYSNVCSDPYRILAEERGDDLLQVADEIKKQSWHTGKIGAIGFSHGGGTVVNLAFRPEKKSIDYVISYYPACYWRFVGRDMSKVYLPIQMHLASEDTWTTPNWCGDPSKYTESYLYIGATHAFDMSYPPRNYNGHWLKYDKEADSLSYKRVEQFLKEQNR